MPSRLIGDEIRVRQMITNLLTNAVKYTSAGKITMTLGFQRVSDDKIILKKHSEPHDIFTGSTEDLIEYEGKLVSKATIKKLAQLAGLL